jgi:hypothetical protein
LAKRKRDESKAGRDRFIRVEKNGSSGGFDKETRFGTIKVYIDKYERTFSLADGDLIMTVSLDKVADLIKQSGET